MPLLDGIPLCELIKMARNSVQCGACKEQSGEVNNGEGEDVDKSIVFFDKHSKSRSKNPQSTEYEPVIDPEFLRSDELRYGLHIWLTKIIY